VAKVSWLFLSTTLIAITVGIAFYHVDLDRANLPNFEPFVGFDFPTIGHVYDINGRESRFRCSKKSR
jgi:hypothetical protein